MRRILLVLSVAVVMAAMLVFTMSTGFALAGGGKAAAKCKADEVVEPKAGGVVAKAPCERFGE